MDSLGSQFLSASAGSGKTFALSKRFCRLVMAGAPPESVCALTFTRAATREIFGAVVRRLLDGDVSDGPRLTRAEALASLMEALPRLQISTIDAFSSRVARLFAYELGLDPDFTLYEEGDSPEARDLLRETTRRAMAVSPRRSAEALLRGLDVREPGNATARSLSGRLRDLFREMRAVYRRAPEGWGDLRRLGDGLPRECDDRRAAAQVLAGLADHVPEACPNSVRQALPRFLGALLPEVGGVREVRTRWGGETPLAQLAKAAATGAFAYGNAKKNLPTLTDAEREAARALREDFLARDLRQTAEHTAKTRAAVAALDAAAAELADETGLLGFGELTALLAERLGGQLWMARPDALHVAYRMDAAVRHLMIDEFQDTSATQWAVLANMASELAAGDDSTFFYVGDVKQSIYGWRGGDATLFGDPTRVPAVPRGKPLLRSYRSSPAVIAMVNRAMALGEDDLDAAEPWQREALARWMEGWEAHTAHRDDQGYAACIRLAGNREDWLATAADLIAARVRDLAGRKVSVAVLAATNGVFDSDDDGRPGLLALLRKRGVHAAIDGRQSAAATRMGQLVCGLLHWLADPRATRWGEIARRLGLTDRPDGETLAAWVRQISEEGYAAWLGACFAGPAWERRLTGQDRDTLAALRRGLEGLDAHGRADPTAALDLLRGLTVPCSADAGVVSLMTIHHSKGLTYDVVFTLLAGSLREQRSPYEEGPGWVLGRTVFDATRLETPALAAAIGKRRAARYRDDLCALYVAITRARREQIVLVTEKDAKTPAGRGWLFARKIQAGEPRALPGAEGRAEMLYEEGAAGWFRGADVPSRAATPPFEPPMRRWAKAAAEGPSETELPSERARASTVADLLGGGAPAARGFGVAQHARFAAIAWSDEPPCFPEVFRKPDEPCDLWRERPFAVLLRGEGAPRRVAGQFDRVHVFPASRRAVVYDFKTSREAVATPAYARQMREYRAAVAALTGFAPGDVRAVLLFTRQGVAVEVADA